MVGGRGQGHCQVEGGLTGLSHPLSTDLRNGQEVNSLIPGALSADSARFGVPLTSLGANRCHGAQLPRSHHHHLPRALGESSPIEYLSIHQSRIWDDHLSWGSVLWGWGKVTRTVTQKPAGSMRRAEDDKYVAESSVGSVLAASTKQKSSELHVQCWGGALPALPLWLPQDLSHHTSGQDPSS